MTKVASPPAPKPSAAEEIDDTIPSEPSHLPAARCRRPFQGLSQDDIPRHTARGSIGARAQRRCGFPGLPGQKKPATPRGCKDASKNPDMVRHWWGLEPRCNVAIATGVASEIFVVDVDGVDAELELRRLEAAHGALPTTVDVITARGRHLYFKVPDTPVRNSAGRIAPGIDVRGDGGYVLAPPSITRAAARTRGLSIARTQSFRRRTSCWPGLPGTLTAAAR